MHTTTLTSFNDLFHLLPSRGWLTWDEAQLLHQTVEATDGDILEVGCYYGRSTVLLGTVAKASGRHVHAVDPFEGFDDGDPSGEDAAKSIVRTLIDLRLQSTVTIYIQSIEDWVPKPVGFAYLDGDHTYVGTLNQIAKALACGARAIAAHDVNDSGGGVEVRDAALDILGPWSERVERLAVWRLR